MTRRYARSFYRRKRELRCSVVLPEHAIRPIVPRDPCEMNPDSLHTSNIKPRKICDFFPPSRDFQVIIYDSSLYNLKNLNFYYLEEINNFDLIVIVESQLLYIIIYIGTLLCTNVLCSIYYLYILQVYIHFRIKENVIYN